MQGDLSTRARALRFPAVLTVAHTAMAGFIVALIYQIGTVSGGLLPRSTALAICLVAAAAAIAVDVRAVRHNTYSVGLKRQTAKVLAHDPERQWWVTPLFWGLDTGLIWSTFRVSCASWVVLLSAFLNVAPQWTGLVFGAAFCVPLLVAVCIGEPDTFTKPGGWRLRAVQLMGMALLAALPVRVMVGAYMAG